MTEGIIKYKSHFLKDDLHASKLTDTLIDLRQKLYERSFIGAYSNGLGYGNVSLRIPDSNQFYISGSGTGRVQKISVNHLSLVYKCQPENNELWCRGQVQASSESMTHYSIYKISDQLRCVIHIHDMKLWEKYLHNKPTTPFSASYGSVEICNEISKLVHASDSHQSGIIVMGGHEEGILIYGSSIQYAWKQLMQL